MSGEDLAEEWELFDRGSMIQPPGKNRRCES